MINIVLIRPYLWDITLNITSVAKGSLEFQDIKLAVPVLVEKVNHCLDIVLFEAALSVLKKQLTKFLGIKCHIVIPAESNPRVRCIYVAHPKQV